MTVSELIAAMQDDTKKAKALLARIAENADKLAALDYASGNMPAHADGLIWAGSVREIHGAMIKAHGVASKALIQHYPDAMTRGPGR